MPASRIGLGDTLTKRVDRGRSIYVAGASAKSVKPYCGHQPERAECEQWMPTAREQDRVFGQGPMWWFAQYPGRPECNALAWNEHECQVEHPSRPCDPWEADEDAAAGLNPKDCARPNSYAGRDVVDRTGANGGPPGPRTICVAVHGHPENRQCRTWDLQ